MTDPTPRKRKRTPEERAQQYVNGVLRPDDTYEDALAALDRLKAEQDNMVRCAAAKRDLHEKMEMREQEIIVRERATFEGSQAAFDREIKAVLQQDDEMIGFRAGIRAASTEYEQAEAGARHEEFQLRLAAARLEELAGRERFYAAVKTQPVATANDTDTTTES